MTAPAGFERLSDGDIQPGKAVFRSRLLIGGVIPAGTSMLTFTSFNPGFGFVEQSPMTGMRRWQHERRIDEVPGGCRVTDTLNFEPSLFPGLTARFVALFFHHRHRRLRRMFGEMK
ncbi:hypothetical protein [Blastomonas sp. SL216]|uniref:hypothetical protein n=1 Tax=Blastomonas sp. SL216 TaxID=2995169 RepID=UPI002377A123|nr:hypothetical protein OU999_06515 [Blastomonas sp. SL216]